MSKVLYIRKSPRFGMNLGTIGLLPTCLNKVAGRTGLEPATSCVTGRYSNQLSYRPLSEYWYSILRRYQQVKGILYLLSNWVKPMKNALLDCICRISAKKKPLKNSGRLKEGGCRLHYIEFLAIVTTFAIKIAGLSSVLLFQSLLFASK